MEWHGGESDLDGFWNGVSRDTAVNCGDGGSPLRVRKIGSGHNSWLSGVQFAHYYERLYAGVAQKWNETSASYASKEYFISQRY